MEKRFEKLLSCLGKELSAEIKSGFNDFESINEILILSEKPVRIYSKNKKIIESRKIISSEETREIFANLCENSVHAYKNEICEGFITAEGGIRIGICGTAIYENGKINGIKDISALNIRIPHEIFGIAERIIPLSDEGGILIIGPPCSGKTTLLRDFSRIASLRNHLTIVDERKEISGTYRGKASFDVGNASVLNGFIKSDGIRSAVRSMAPDIIVCDEFGDENDVNSAVFAMKSGVKIVASMHALDPEDFLSKPLAEEIIRKGIFRNLIFLNKEFKIFKTIGAGELNF